MNQLQEKVVFDKFKSQQEKQTCNRNACERDGTFKVENKRANGAEALVNALQESGVEICFANPGTSELHIVAALGDASNMRSVLCLFEGVVTGAADGYYRMARRPAATLLHLGPGLGYGIANLHNAQKACSPIINIVGQHARPHMKYDLPISSDIEGLAKTVSGSVETIKESEDIPEVVNQAMAITGRPANNIATVVVPSDIAWSEVHLENPIQYKKRKNLEEVTSLKVKNTAEILETGDSTVIFVNTSALSKDVIDLLGKIKKKTGCRIVSELFVPRITKGAGEVCVERVPFRQNEAHSTYKDVKEVILIGANHPRSFFAYPDQSDSSMFPAGCRITPLTTPEENSNVVVKKLVEVLGVGDLNPEVLERRKTKPAVGELTTRKVGESLAAMLPENAIIADDGITSTFDYWQLFKHAPSHDWLYNTGGSIGDGIPLAVGAALAAPDRKVISLSGDGSAMYTIQALWTQARENLNITNIIFSNRSYKILNNELDTVKISERSETMRKLLDLSSPNIEFKKLAESLGVKAVTVNSMAEFNSAFSESIENIGPFLINVEC